MPQPVSKSWYEAAHQWTDLESAASLLEETKGAVLAQMMTKHGDIPVSRAETMAKASPEWRDHVEKIVKARTAANKAKIKMDFWKMKFWEAQSHAATERIEAKL